MKRISYASLHTLVADNRMQESCHLSSVDNKTVVSFFFYYIIVIIVFLGHFSITY